MWMWLTTKFLLRSFQNSAPRQLKEPETRPNESQTKLSAEQWKKKWTNYFPIAGLYKIKKNSKNDPGAEATTDSENSTPKADDMQPYIYINNLKENKSQGKQKKWHNYIPPRTSLLEVWLRV